MRALLLTASLVATAATATPIVDSSQQRYLISGATSAELRAALERHPMNQGRKHRVATTAADIRWQPKFGVRDRRCRISSVKVTLTVVTTLPAWDPPASASAELRANFKRFLDALTQHEAGHLEIAQRAAQRIEDELWRAPSRKSCEGYGERLNEIANAIFDAAAQEQADYDARTEFGAKQGVVLP